MSVSAVLKHTTRLGLVDEIVRGSSAVPIEALVGKHVARLFVIAQPPNIFLPCNAVEVVSSRYGRKNMPQTACV